MNNKTTTERNRQRYCVKQDKRCVTTTVYLSDETIVITKVYNDGNVETLVNPP